LRGSQPGERQAALGGAAIRPRLPLQALDHGPVAPPDLGDLQAMVDVEAIQQRTGDFHFGRQMGRGYDGGVEPATPRTAGS